jgi:cell division septation protein DedD
MASGGKRGAGERVLESRHVIGLFMLMMVFSAVFFSLGYVMGRKQYDGQVSAAGNGFVGRTEAVLNARPDVAPKKTPNTAPEPEVSDPATSSSSQSPWIYEESSKPAKVEPHLEPSPKAPATPPVSHTVNAKSSVPPVVAPHTTSSKSLVTTSAPLVPAGSVILQVAALEKQDDALALATSLQKKHFSAYVQTPRKDKFYRVQVGPFKDQKSADAAKKGLETAGFKAFYVKH